MAVTLSHYESIDTAPVFDLVISDQVSTDGSWNAASEETPLLMDKLRVPKVRKAVARPRIETLLDRSRTQFPATLLCGRAGTGKTTIAASFAKRFSRVAWYRVDQSDSDWAVFSRYLAAALYGVEARSTDSSRRPGAGATQEMDRFLVRHFTRPEMVTGEVPLIVIDDVHHVFDAPWFDDLFTLMLYSLPEAMHLVMLCRSKPPQPLWRLRSKQMLNVLDESVICFDEAEACRLFAAHGRGKAEAAAAHKKSYGRVSRLLQLAAV